MLQTLVAPVLSALGVAFAGTISGLVLIARTYRSIHAYSGADPELA